MGASSYISTILRGASSKNVLRRAAPSAPPSVANTANFAAGAGAATTTSTSAATASSSSGAVQSYQKAAAASVETTLHPGSALAIGKSGLPSMSLAPSCRRFGGRWGMQAADKTQKRIEISESMLPKDFVATFRGLSETQREALSHLMKHAHK